MPLRMDDLHLVGLGVQATVQPPILTTTPIGLAPPKALTPRDGAAIYAEVSRYGFTRFQVVEGGVQIATSDGSCVVTLTGGGFQFNEDLTQTSLDLSLDKLGVVVGHYAAKLPGMLLMVQAAHVEAVWENLGTPNADAYIRQRFLKPEATRLVEGLFESQQLQGAGFRVVISRPATIPLPPGVVLGQPDEEPMEAFEVRVEPLYADRAKLFVFAQGTFTPTADFTLVEPRARSVADLLWDKVAPNMALQA